MFEKHSAPGGIKETISFPAHIHILNQLPFQLCFFNSCLCIVCIHCDNTIMKQHGIAICKNSFAILWCLHYPSWYTQLPLLWSISWSTLVLQRWYSFGIYACCRCCCIQHFHRRIHYGGVYYEEDGSKHLLLWMCNTRVQYHWQMSQNFYEIVP